MAIAGASSIERILASSQGRKSRYWERFDIARDGPDFEGKKVLEIGCGQGWRCLEIAARGAIRVVGIDTFQESVCVATKNLQEFPELAGIVEYKASTIHDLEEHEFDAVISENAFEHILDVAAVLESIRRCLRLGGKAYIGFSPLYHSAFGDHGWMQKALPGGDRFLVPWGHLLAPQQWLFRRMESIYGKPVRSTVDWPFLCLNQKTAADFRRLFRDSNMRIVTSKSNANFGWRGKLLGSLSKIPILDRYFTVGLYYILERCS